MFFLSNLICKGFKSGLYFIKAKLYNDAKHRKATSWQLHGFLAGFLFLFVVVSTNLYAQGESTSSAEAATPGEETKEKGLADILELDVFRPVAEEFELIEQGVDMRYYKLIQSAIAGVKQELNSTLIALNSAKKKFDDYNTLKGYYYYRVISPAYVNYYKYVTPSVRNQFYLARSDEVMRQIGEALEERKTIFPLLIEEAELKNLVYEYRTLTGMIAMLRGGKGNLKKAIQNFEYVLGENEEEVEYFISDEEKKETYNYLVGANNELYLAYRANSPESYQYLREKLFYMWNLVTLNNSSNEKLREAKLQILFDRYASVMDPTGSNFNNLYKPYRETSLKRIKDVETRLSIGSNNVNADRPASNASGQ